MNWIDKLERKFGRYGIPNLTFYIVICYVLGYILMQFNPALLNMMSLEPAMILQGQVWRLITWVIYPPSTGNIMWFAISILFFYYPIGSSLERTWGTFRYNLYIFSGLLFVMIAAFLTYFVTGRIYLMGNVFTTYYVSMSVFLAYAASYPNVQILLFFVIPIRMKWMAWVYGIMIVYDMVTYIRLGVWVMAVPIVASFLNFILFFFTGGRMSRFRPKEVKRRRDFQKAVNRGRVNPETGGIAKHKCAICGRTELDDPNLEFRFCSKCNGNYEYCQDHLFTHQHVK